MQFFLFLPKFGCHGNSLNSLNIQVAHLNHEVRKTLLLCEKYSSISMQGTEICAILA